MLRLHNTHSGEHIAAEYWSQGWYNPDVLARINHFMRDWRTGDVIDIDPGVLDILHELQARCGADRPIQVICGYRSPATNAMLAKRSSAVAKNSFHMKGMAVDIRVPDVNLKGLRQMALDLRAGGVGYYPRSGFLHVDTGPIRTW